MLKTKILNVDITQIASSFALLYYTKLLSFVANVTKKWSFYIFLSNNERGSEAFVEIAMNNNIL
jgi:hypothetical protein